MHPGVQRPQAVLPVANWIAWMGGTGTLGRRRDPPAVLRTVAPSGRVTACSSLAWTHRHRSSFMRQVYGDARAGVP